MDPLVIEYTFGMMGNVHCSENILEVMFSRIIEILPGFQSPASIMKAHTDPPEDANTTSGRYSVSESRQQLLTWIGKPPPEMGSTETSIIAFMHSCIHAFFENA